MRKTRRFKTTRSKNIKKKEKKEKLKQCVGLLSDTHFFTIKFPKKLNPNETVYLEIKKNKNNKDYWKRVDEKI